MRCPENATGGAQRPSAHKTNNDLTCVTFLEFSPKTVSRTISKNEK